MAIARRRGGLDGDGLGATIELAVAASSSSIAVADLMAQPLILALGGTRSGKSRFGLARTRELAGDGRAWFLATACPATPSSTTGSAATGPTARPTGRRSTSGTTWPRAVAGPTAPEEPLLLDGLTLWLSAILRRRARPIDPLLDGPVAAALAASSRGPARSSS